VPLIDALDIGEPNAGAPKLILTVKPLEYPKEFSSLFRIETSAIGANVNHCFIVSGGIDPIAKRGLIHRPKRLAFNAFHRLGSISLE
jgi:hypothetical protein